MFTHCKSFFTLAITLVLAFFIHNPACAAAGFCDVPADTPLYESVVYLSQRGITNGTGDGCFSPDASITVRQWAMMLDRAFGEEGSQDEAEPGQSSLAQAYRRGWISLPCILAPDEGLCRGELYDSAFKAIGLPVYDWSLYPGGTRLSEYENCLRVSAELGLCAEDADPWEMVARGEAAALLHAVLTQDLQVEEPPMLDLFLLKILSEQISMTIYWNYAEYRSRSWRTSRLRDGYTLWTTNIWRNSAASIKPPAPGQRTMEHDGFMCLPPVLRFMSSAISWTAHWDFRLYMKSYSRKRRADRTGFCGIMP